MTFRKFSKNNLNIETKHCNSPVGSQGTILVDDSAYDYVGLILCEPHFLKNKMCWKSEFRNIINRKVTR